MSKILIFANSSSGVYEFRRELIRELIERGNNIIVSSPSAGREPELKEIGCEIIETNFDRRGINPIKDFLLFVKYRRLVKKEKPDLVITYTIKPNIYGGFACRLLKVPYAVNITGLGTAFENDGFLKKIVIAMYKAALKKAKVVFFENSDNRDTFVQEKIIDSSKSKVLNGAGVNIDHFTLSEYPCDEASFKYLFVGRIMKEKGINELFSAMKKMRDDGCKCKLMVLGRYEEGYEQQIKQYVDDGWLEYYGFQSDVRPFIAKAHCFVLPSYHEGMANTNLECASSGRPIITSSIPGCREAVVDGSGLLCDPKNVDSLYQTMKAMYSLSFEERKQMGLKGRKHMEDVFDKKKVVAETIKHLF